MKKENSLWFNLKCDFFATLNMACSGWCEYIMPDESRVYRDTLFNDDKGWLTDDQLSIRFNSIYDYYNQFDFDDDCPF